MPRWIHWSEVRYVFSQFTIVRMFACKRVINRRFERHSVVYESDLCIHKQMCVRLASLLDKYTLKNKKLHLVGNVQNDM